MEESALTEPGPPDGDPAPVPFWRAVGLTFESSFRHLRTCLALVSVYAVLNGVASAIGAAVSIDLDPLRASSGELLAIGAAAIAGVGMLVIVAIFIYPPTIGALSLVGSGAVSADVVETHGIVGRMLDRALEAIGAFVLTALVLLVAPITAGVLALIAGFVGGAEAGFATLIFALIVLSIPAVYVFVRLSLAVPVVVREGAGPVAAMRRSWELVGGGWWWAFGVGLVVFFGASILSGVISSIFSLGALGLPGSAPPESPNFVLVAVGSTAGAAVQGVLYGVVTGVLYAARAQLKPAPELALPDDEDEPQAPDVPAEPAPADPPAEPPPA